VSRHVNAVAGRLSLRPPQRHSLVLDRDATRWFRPAKGQFQIFYRMSGAQEQYVPDFVVETESALLLIELKARNEMDDPEVLAKRTAAEEWCRNASTHAATYGGKPWSYVFLPHDVVAENMTLARLADDSVARA
jgi:type III restriction enzyme